MKFLAYLVTLLLAFVCHITFAQISNIDTLCLNSQISLSNPEGFGENLLWDFCEGDFSSQPTFSFISSNIVRNVRDHKLFEYDDRFFNLFITSNGRLYVREFSENYQSIIAQKDFGNPDNMLNIPRELEVIVDEKVVFIGNQNSNKVIRFRFENGFDNPPVVDSLSGLGLNTQLIALSSFQIGEEKFLFIATGTGNFHTINFGSSYSNTPSIQNVKTFMGVKNVFSLEILDLNGENVGIISTTAGQLFSLKTPFAPKVTLLSSGLVGNIGFVKPKLVIDRGRIAFVSPQYGSFNLHQLYFNSQTFVADSYQYYQGFLPRNSLTSIEIVKNSIGYIGLAIDFSSGELYRFEFQTECKANLQSSTLSNPELLLEKPGKIYFSVTDQQTQQYQADSVWVLYPIEPNFQSDFNCFGATTQFYNTSLARGTKIQSVLWDFGDNGATSTELNPSFAFSSDGVFQVSLNTIDECGLEANITKTVKIYREDDVQPDFEIVQTLQCSLDSLQFMDQSAFDEDSIVAWKWNFGDGNESILQNPRHAYASEGAYQVSLNLLLKSGCERNVIKTPNIISGTIIDFSFYKNCEGDSTEFTDASTQAFPNTEISRLWTFDDPASGANTSTEINPKHLFTAPGLYFVNLSVENSLGCINTYTKRVEVFENPVIIIEDQKALSNRPFQFRVDEIISADPVQSYLWQFGVDGANSSEKEPFFIYSDEGVYQANVAVQTLSGCEGESAFSVNVDSGNANINFPILAYSAIDTIDAAQSISIQNESYNYTQFSWDFDEGDLKDSAQLTTVPLINSAPFRQIRDLQLLKENGVYYAIAVTNDSKIRVFKFTNGLKSEPLVFDYANPNSLLLNAWGLDFIKENGKWRGLVANYGSSTGLVYFSFENGLEQAPIASKVNHTFTSLKLANVKIRKFKGDLHAFVLGNSGWLEILNFGGKLFDGLQEGAANYNLPIVANAYSFDIIVHQEAVYGVFITLNGRQYVFKLNSNLQFQGTVQEIPTSLTGVASLGSGVVTWDAGEMVHIYSEYNTGKIHRINIPEDLLLAKVKHKVLNQSTGLSLFATLELVKEDSKWQGLGLNFSTGALFNIEFRDDNNISPVVSIEYEPTVTFNTPGTFYYTLKATDHLGHTSYLTDSVRVRRPPIVNFNTDYNCTYFDTFFNADIITDGTDIASYLWEFGDDSTSTDQSPIYRYANSGIYTVKLTVLDSRGATGIFSKEVRIFPEDAFIVDFDFDEVLCANNVEPFINGSNGLEESISSYSWDFGDPLSSEPNTSNLVSPNHIFQQPGFYTVTLTATGESGCPVSISKELEIDYAPEVDFEAFSTCLGQITSFEIEEDAITPVSYYWDFADGFSADISNPEHSFAESAFYNVSLSAEYDNGCTYTLTKPIFVPPLPIMNFEYEIPCQGTQISFTDRSSSEFAQIVERKWTFGDGSGTFTSAEASINHSFAQSGTFQVKLEITTNDGCKSSLTQPVQVLPTAQLDFDWDGSCEDMAITFTDESDLGNAGAVQSRVWRINGTVYTNLQPINTFNQAGNYNVILEITTQNGCLKTLSKTINIKPLPQPDFEVLQACVGQEIILENRTITQDPINQITWRLLGTNQVVQDQEIAGFDIASAGFYDVALSTTTSNACEAEVIKTIRVFAAPSANFTANPSFGAPPLMVQFANSSTNASSFQWDFADGNTSVLTSPQHEFLDKGDYNVRLTAYNTAGCMGVEEQTIRVVDPAIDLVLNSVRTVEEGDKLKLLVNMSNRGTVTMNACDLQITLNNGISVTERFEGNLNPNQSINYPLKFEINQTNQITLNLICVKGNWTVGELMDINSDNNEACLVLGEKAQLLPVFPNPAQNQITVPMVIPTSGEISISIQDAQGHQVYLDAFTDTRQGLNHMVINTQNWPIGIYLIRVSYKGGFFSSKCVIAR